MLQNSPQTHTFPTKQEPHMWVKFYWLLSRFTKMIVYLGIFIDFLPKWKKSEIWLSKTQWYCTFLLLLCWCHPKNSLLSAHHHFHLGQNLDILDRNCPSADFPFPKKLVNFDTFGTTKWGADKTITNSFVVWQQHYSY